MRLIFPFAFVLTLAGPAALAQDAPSQLPDAPSQMQSQAEDQAQSQLQSPVQSPAQPQVLVAGNTGVSSSLLPASLYSFSLYPEDSDVLQQQDSGAAEAARQSDPPKKKPNPLIGDDLDANGNPIPLNRRQPKRILGILPNYRTVSAGAAVHPPGWKYNFSVATRQAFDPSSFLFLGLTSISAEGLNSHPALRKGVHGFYSYTWRGLIDKTDGTYLSAFVLASALREDTRYYPLGDGHSIFIRSLYVISRQGVARDYTGHQVFNMAGLGGKVLTQYISRFYYPAGTSDLSVLATKFAYSAMRDIGFSSIREFYPDIAAHYIRKHREKAALDSQRDVNSVSPAPPQQLQPQL